MGKFDLFRSESLSGKRVRNSYKVSESLIECCKKIMSLPEFEQTKIRLTLEGEEMKPDQKVLISSFAELLSLNKEANVSSCMFHGSYKGMSVDIVVDYGLKMLNIVSDDSGIIESIKNDLEG